MPDFFSEPKKTVNRADELAAETQKRAEEVVPEYVNRTTSTIQRLKDSFSGLKSFADKKEAPPAHKLNNAEISEAFDKTTLNLHLLTEKVADLAMGTEEVSLKK